MGLWDNIKNWYEEKILRKKPLRKYTKETEEAKTLETNNLIQEAEIESKEIQVLPDMKVKQKGEKTSKQTELQKTQETDLLIKESTKPTLFNEKERTEIDEVRKRLEEKEKISESKEQKEVRKQRYMPPTSIRDKSEITAEINSKITKGLEQNLQYAGSIDGLSYAQYSKNAILARGITVDDSIAELIVANEDKFQERFRTRVEIYGNGVLVRTIEWNGASISKIHPIFSEEEQIGEVFGEGTGSGTNSPFNDKQHTIIDEIVKRNGTVQPQIIKNNEITTAMEITDIKYYTDFA